MSIVYRIDPEVGITYVVFDGAVTSEEYDTHTRRMMADPAWPPARKLHLTDVTSQIKANLVSNEVISEMAALWLSHGRRVAGMKIAVVADEGFDNARLFETAVLKHGPTMVVFNMVSTACIWLGIEAAQAQEAIKALRAEARKDNSK